MSNAPDIAVILPPREKMLKARTGAVGLYVREYVRHSAFNATTTVFTGAACDYEDGSFVSLADWKRWFLRDTIAYARSVARAVVAAKSTHVDVHNRPLVFRELVRCLPPEVRVSLFLHNDPQGIQLLKTAKERQQVLDLAHHVVCVSDFLRGRFIQGLCEQGVARNRHKIHVLPSGIEPREEPAFPRENMVFLAGRLLPDKGVPQLAEAFYTIMDSCPEWTLVICGEDEQGLFEQADGSAGIWGKKLAQRCRFLGVGSHETVMDYFSRSAISVVPSVWEEPFGRTALEAMACGSALVTSGTGGLKEIAGEHGKTSLITNPAVSCLAQALQLLIRDDALRRRLQRDGRAHVHRLFDIRKLAEKLDGLRGD